MWGARAFPAWVSRPGGSGIRLCRSRTSSASALVVRCHGSIFASVACVDGGDYVIGRISLPCNIDEEGEPRESPSTTARGNTEGQRTPLTTQGRSRNHHHHRGDDGPPVSLMDPEQIAIPLPTPQPGACRPGLRMRQGSECSHPWRIVLVAILLLSSPADTRGKQTRTVSGVGLSEARGTRHSTVALDTLRTLRRHRRVDSPSGTP